MVTAANTVLAEVGIRDGRILAVWENLDRAENEVRGDGYTSFKVFMTYDGLALNDRQILDVFDCAHGKRPTAPSAMPSLPTCRS